MASRTLGFTVGAVVLAAAACSSNNGKVTVSAKSAAATSSAATPGSLDLGNGIVIDRVRVAIRKVKLEGAVDAADAGADGGADDPANHALVAAAKGGADDAGSGDGGVDDHGGQGLGGDDDADEIRVGPFLVDLTGDALATGGLSKVFDGVVPPGTYRELKVVVDVVPPALAGADAGLADMNGKSVIIDGKLDGTAFSFTSSLHAEAKRETTLVVGASTANVTLTVDPGAWFKAADGSRLDPSAPASKPQIEANIKASVDAFDDDDHDGRDDHGGHGADDGAGHT